MLECNWPAVQVYLACQWTLHVGVSAPYWQGIATSEAVAAMHAHRIPAAARADTLRRVQIMVAAARSVLNKAD